MTVPIAVVSFALLVLAALPLRADDWPAPRTKEVFSQSREYFVRVIPGKMKGGHASAEFYRRAPDRSYRLVAEASLLNPVAPVEFLLADSGHLLSLDNWHNVGYGKVVAIYDPRGKLIRTYELRELFDAEEITRFPHSVSSIHWRKGPAYIRQDQTTALVTVASGADFLFGMESGAYKYCETRDQAYRCRGATQVER